MLEGRWRGVGTTTGLVIVALVVGRVWASGIPTAGSLTYSGLLQTPDGAPLGGDHVIQVRLWRAPIDGEVLCSTAEEPLRLVVGRFSIGLGGCFDAIKAEPNTFVEVIVDRTSLGRTQVGATPYAIESDHATSASNAVGALETQLEALESRLGPDSAFLARIGNGAAQLFANGAVTTVDFASPVFDRNSEFDDETDVFVPKTSGYYSLRCDLEWNPAGVAATYAVSLLVNGTEVMASELYGGAAGDLHLDASIVTRLEQGNSVSCMAWQNSGEARSLRTEFARSAFQGFRLSSLP
jgi:hypothetical protein